MQRRERFKKKKVVGGTYTPFAQFAIWSIQLCWLNKLHNFSFQVGISLNKLHY